MKQPSTRLQVEERRWRYTSRGTARSRRLERCGRCGAIASTACSAPLARIVTCTVERFVVVCKMLETRFLGRPLPACSGQRRRQCFIVSAAQVKGFLGCCLNRNVFFCLQQVLSDSCAFNNPCFHGTLTQRLNSIEVSTSLCGSDNPGSNPGYCMWTHPWSSWL